MKRIFVVLLAACVLLVSCKDKKSVPESGPSDKSPTEKVDKPEVQPADNSVPRGAQLLIQAYPDFVTEYADGQVLFKDGSKMTYDDGKKKSFVEKMDQSDLEDMFAFTYDMSSWDAPAFQQDPGRARCEAFFLKMYGGSGDEVHKHLVMVDWFGEKVPFTTVNHADDSLRAVARDLAGKPELLPYLKSSGSVNWRKVAGTNRISAHSWGMTIDVGAGHNDYWQWSAGTKDENAKIPYRNSMSREVVKAFERHGFIWGGRWYHYDTMHFEFRPEIILSAKR